MRLLSTWSDLPAKRRHLYVYAGLLIFALAGSTIKASFVSASPHLNEKFVKPEVAKFLGIDELSKLEPGAQPLLNSSTAK